MLWLVLLGLCSGSFVDALVWRMHKQAERREKQLKPDPKLSMTRGRSMCPNCKHTLGFLDLIPVFSWLALKGKCRYCHKPYGWHTVALELSLAGLFVLSYVVWPYGFDTSGCIQFGVWLIVLVGFAALALYDLRWYILPDRIIFPLAGLVAAQVLICCFLQGDWHYLWGAILGVLSLAGVFFILFQLSDGGWIGGGDVKLAIVLGLLVAGPLEAMLVLLISSVLGLMFSLPSLAKGQRGLSSKIPYGPFLIAATIIVYLFGTGWINWYQHHLL